jgi:hypothetical protein
VSILLFPVNGYSVQKTKEMCFLISVGIKKVDVRCSSIFGRAKGERHGKILAGIATVKLFLFSIHPIQLKWIFRPSHLRLPAFLTLRGSEIELYCPVHACIGHPGRSLFI